MSPAEEEINRQFREALDAGGPSIWTMTEAELLAAIIPLCEQRGIWWVHIDTPYRNKRRQNLIGFPDLFLCGPAATAFRELKSQSGRMRPAQNGWKHRLLGSRQNYDVWRPEDLESGRIERELDLLCSPG